jgi:hypothetical protein
MTDVYHYWSGDLQISATGDLVVTDPTTAGQQKVLRRLLTNPLLADVSGNPQSSPDYTFHPPYGAGLARKIGSPVNIAALTAMIRAQLLQESVVARKPAPQITLTPFINGVTVYIAYNDARTLKPVTLSFDVSQ